MQLVQREFTRGGDGWIAELSLEPVYISCSNNNATVVSAGLTPFRKGPTRGGGSFENSGRSVRCSRN